MTNKIVVASSNPGKIQEIRQILEPFGIAISTKDDFEGWPAIEETGDTYFENALLKAAAIAKLTDLPALADDSGIEIDHLDGRPGVRSARFAGDDATPEQNNQLLIERLQGVPAERRGARYRAAMVLAKPDGTAISSEGVCEGSIASVSKGSGGFGYDPWFIPSGMGRHMAELSADAKHDISHRGKALRELAPKIKPFLDE